MAYFEFHDTLPNHLKTRRLAAALKIGKVQAVGHLACLFAYMIANKPGGVIDAADVPFAAEWVGDPRKFLNAISAKGGYVELDGNDAKIHDWEHYTKGYRKAQADAQRLRDQRAEEARLSRDGSALVALSPPRAEQNRTERTEQSREEGPSRADALPASHAALAPLQDLQTEPTAHDGLVRAFAFCRMPGLQCKRKCIEDLKRQGVDEGRIMFAAHDPANRSLDFFDIMKSLKPERTQKSEWDKAMDILKARELSKTREAK